MRATSIVTVVGYFSIHPGQAAQFRTNCQSMVALRDKEPGHLASAYSFVGDQLAVSREDYENAEAVLQHMQVGQHIYEKTRSIVDITRVELHGPPGELDKLSQIFSELSPQCYITECGFRR